MVVQKQKLTCGRNKCRLLLRVCAVLLRFALREEGQLLRFSEKLKRFWADRVVTHAAAQMAAGRTK